MYYRLKEETFEDIADAIRAKSGTTGDIQAEDFASAIMSLNVGENTDAAAESASAAAASAASAASSALAAADSAGNVTSYTKDAEAWAVGKRGGVDVSSGDETYQNNSKYWADLAISNTSETTTQAGIATNKANEAATKALDAEAWAIGKRNNVDVDSEDATYHNSAKYWAEQAQSAVVVEEFTDNEVETIFNAVFTS